MHSGVFGVNDVSESEMREILSLYNINVHATASYSESMLFYNEFIDGNGVQAFYEQMAEVKFPHIPIDCFNNIFESS